jgi:hypothetical protein
MPELCRNQATRIIKHLIEIQVGAWGFPERLGLFDRFLCGELGG